jgi:hypothetical protein
LSFALKQLSLTTHGKKSALNYSRETLNLILESSSGSSSSDIFHDKLSSLRELSEAVISNFKQFVLENKD